MFSIRIVRAGRRPLVHLGGSAPVWEDSSLHQLGSGSVWLGTGVRESSRVALWLPVRLAQTPDDVSAFSSVVFLFLLFIRFFGNISASGPRGGVRQEESERVVSSPAVDSCPKWCIFALRFSFKKWQCVPERQGSDRVRLLGASAQGAFPPSEDAASFSGRLRSQSPCHVCVVDASAFQPRARWPWHAEAAPTEGAGERQPPPCAGRDVERVDGRGPRTGRQDVSWLRPSGSVRWRSRPCHRSPGIGGHSRILARAESFSTAVSGCAHPGGVPVPRVSRAPECVCIWTGILEAAALGCPRAPRRHGGRRQCFHGEEARGASGVQVGRAGTAGGLCGCGRAWASHPGGSAAGTAWVAAGTTNRFSHSWPGERGPANSSFLDRRRELSSAEDPTCDFGFLY